jgi:hypothetical protein
MLVDQIRTPSRIQQRYYKQAGVSRASGGAEKSYRENIAAAPAPRAAGFNFSVRVSSWDLKDCQTLYNSDRQSDSSDWDTDRMDSSRTHAEHDHDP